MEMRHFFFLIVYATDDKKKTEHLLVLDGAKEMLQLFTVDLLEEGSFDFVIDGCEGIFHTAYPFNHCVSDPHVHSFLVL